MCVEGLKQTYSNQQLTKITDFSVYLVGVTTIVHVFTLSTKKPIKNFDPKPLNSSV